MWEKLRCPKCGKTLLWIKEGRIEAKCPRCGHIVRIDYIKVRVKSTGEHET